MSNIEDPPTTTANFDPESAGNNPEIELQFAVKTVEHLEAYEKLITSVPPSKIKLTSMDDDILADLLEQFPEYKDKEALAHLDEDAMKSAAGKERWRKFIMGYEKSLTDYNMGSLVRGDATRPYAEDNAILVTRAQFVALEVARNRAGVNDGLYEEALKKKKASA